MHEAMEDVVLTVTSNDGRLAICKATVDGRTVDQVQFERESDTAKAEFLREFKVGTKRVSKRFHSNDKGFEKAKQEAFLSRSKKRGKQ